MKRIGQVNEPEQREVAAWVGLDWAKEGHAVCLREPGGEVETQRVENSPEALQRWMRGLRERFGGRPVAVALEQFRGGLIHALMECEFLQLYLVNPQTLSSFRKAFQPSGPKSDPGDAELLLELLVSHADRLRLWRPAEASLRQLRLLVEHRRGLVDLRAGEMQRLSEALEGFYPQALQWAGRLDKERALDFLRRWPTLERAKKATLRQLRSWLARHRARGASCQAERIYAQISRAQALTGDEAAIEAGQLRVQACSELIRAATAGLKRYERRIRSLFAQQPDAFLFESLPGAGQVNAPRLLAAFGSDRQRFANAGEVAQWSGIAPVTRRSGKSLRVTWRWASPKFVRQTFHEFAERSIPHSRWARACYYHHRQKGKSRQAAIRELAFKWIRILTRCWKDRRPYDEAQHLVSLGRRNSPVLAVLKELEACGKN